MPARGVQALRHLRRRSIQNLSRTTDEFHPTSDYFAGRFRPRGRGVVRIALAGFGFRLEGLAPAEEAQIRARYGIFATGSAADTNEVRVDVVEAGVPGFLNARGSVGGLPESYRLEQRWEEHRLLAYSYEFAGWYDARTRTAQLALTSKDGEALHRAVENFLRVVTAHRVLEDGGFLLHGAGLVRGGRAHVFFGPSGAGKTTVTLLSEGDLVLGDDLVLVREGDGGQEAFAVPFRGLYREPPETNRSFPLAAFYRLVQHPADSLELLSPARGVGELLASLPFVLESGTTSSAAVEAVSRAASAVPVYRLRFRKSPEFWDLLSEGG